MNEELQQAIVKVLESMTGVAQSAYSFGAEQMPEVIEQLIAFNIVTSASTLVAFFSLSAAGIKLLLKARAAKPKTVINDSYITERYEPNFWWDRYGNESSPHVLVGIASGLAIFCTTVAVFVEGGKLLKLIVAPKVWLIEYAAGLVK
jgi:hypothetical protein